MNEYDDGPLTNGERIIVLAMMAYALCAATGAVWLLIQVIKLLSSSPHRGTICGSIIVLAIAVVGIANARERRP